MLRLTGYESVPEENIPAIIAGQYNVSIDEVNQYEILAIGYWEPSYEGESWILLRKKDTGGLFEVNGSHCSCHGLENQFEPKETTKKYLQSKHFALSCSGATDAEQAAVSGLVAILP